MRRIRLLALVWAMLLVLMPWSVAEEQNLLTNPGFEEIDSDGLPAGWYTEAYVTQAGYTTYAVSDDAYEGEHSAVVNNLGANDARFAQKVKVEPNSLYKLSGWIKAESIADSGRGANLSIEGVYVFSDSVFDDDGQWHYVELYGETDEDQHEVTVFARVGGYSGESQGKAYFDSLSLVQVDSVPGDGVASLWFKNQTQSTVETTGDSETDVASPAWPWLLLIAAAYLVAGAACMRYAMQERPCLVKEPRRASMGFLGGMALAAAARVLLALLVEGYQVDVSCFRAWGRTMSSVGASQFYQNTSFCDYTPAYIYVMGLNDLLSQAGRALGLSVAEAFYHKLIPMACDLVGAYLVYHLARKERFSRIQAETLGLLLAFNPAMFLNSAGWCQIDSVLCVGLLVVAMLAVRRQWAALMPVYVLCALIKPQALMLGPLGLLVLVMDWVKHKEDTRKMLVGLGLSAAVAAIIILPFSIHQKPGWLIEKYSSTLASYAYATVNTANFYYLFNANWVSIDQLAGWLPALCLALAAAAWGGVSLWRNKQCRFRLAEPMLMACFALAYIVMAMVNVSWAVLGYTTMGLAFAIVLPMYVRSGQVRHVPLLGAVLFIILYVLGVKMHERYLFPALLLLGMAFVLHRDKRILLLMAVLSCTVFLNEGIVLDNSLRLGSSMGHLNNDTKALAMLLSLVNVLCVLLSVWTAQRVCVERKAEELDKAARPPRLLRRYEHTPQDVRSFRPDSSLHWRPIDWVLMLTVTAVYAVVCLCNLGSTKAPQNPWTSTAKNETVIIDLGQTYEDFTMLYFAQVSYSDFSVAVSQDGETWSGEYWAEMAQGQCFRWKYLSPCVVRDDGSRTFYSATNYDGLQRLSGRYVRITPQQINLVLNEVIFRDAEGNTIPATIKEVQNANPESPLLSDAANLLDEQDTLEGEPSWYNSTYFDEIYHARTAFEHLNGTQPYETSHPPLGKVIMSWFVAIFGMTPFGWRFAGALAGILMLPAMYLLGKQLTKRTDMAFAAMAMMTLDCMHFTQTRIATIDSFPVLFIILCYFFMLRFMQRDIVLQPLRKVLSDLALSGFFMGCAVSSKWIGAYAGVGLGVLYFWTCIRHIRLSRQASKLLHSGQNAPELRARSQNTLRRLIILCLWCLLFFVAVPVVIYLLSYIPYFSYLRTNGLIDFIQKVIRANEGMLSYHSTPGLGMDHPFYSPWYEWPLITRPMYYAMAQFVPEGYSYSIFCFGNPAVWLVGLAGIGVTLLAWVQRHCYALDGSCLGVHPQGKSWSVAPAFVLIGLLAQFLPWVLVPRGTYIYHYFASIPFLILGTMLMLHWLSQRWPRLGRTVLIVYLLMCLICFIAFYPYASGVLTPVEWLDFMKQFLHVYHA